MEINFPLIKFERYADDIILHCSTEKQAEYILTKVGTRLQECHLELHPTKTKIVYCRDDRRKLSTEKEDRFTFLGYEFKSRACKDKRGRIFYSFTPAISSKAVKNIIKEFRELKIQKWVVAQSKRLQNSLMQKYEDGLITMANSISRNCTRYLEDCTFD
jgi:RNA-directed DNA polymerase